MRTPSTVIRFTSTAAYQQLAQILRGRVTGGRYSTFLPSERQLAGEFGVSRDVVRGALALLCGEGLLERCVPNLPVRVRSAGPRERITLRPDGTTTTVVAARMPTPSERTEWQIPAGVPVLVVGEAVYPAHRYELIIK